jgi:ankyrin repeat protein
MVGALCDRTEVVRVLADAGANLNFQNWHGNTTLIWAAHLGHTEVAKVLADAGANSGLQADLGCTAL